MNVINVTRSSLPPFDEYVEEIRNIWDSHWLTNMGAKHQQLERSLEEYLNVPHVRLFTNGHMALEGALTVLNLHGEIITTPFTFSSTTHAIVRSGCTPVFCDINDRDYTIDVEKIESLITEKTCAILPVHVYGNICEWRAIDCIAKKHNLKVIYDAAHAFGVSQNGVSVANMGDIAMFSFHATKVFNTIEGGALTFHDNSLGSRINRIKNFGITDSEMVESVGFNAKMSEFQAAMGLCNLRHLDEALKRRKVAYNRYVERLAEIPGVRFCTQQPGTIQNYAYFQVVFDGFKYDRNEVFDRLNAQNINARKYFWPLTNSYSFGKRNVEPTPVAKYISERVLALPMYEELTIEDVDRVCDVLI